MRRDPGNVCRAEGPGHRNIGFVRPHGKIRGSRLDARGTGCQQLPEKVPRVISMTFIAHPPRISLIIKSHQSARLSDSSNYGTLSPLTPPIFRQLLISSPINKVRKVATTSKALHKAITSKVLNKVTINNSNSQCMSSSLRREVEEAVARHSVECVPLSSVVAVPRTAWR